jgi:hypothetical protein
MPVIGLLDPRSPDAIRERLGAYRQGLKDNGYVEGHNVTIVYRWPKINSIGFQSWPQNWSDGRSP